MLCFIFYRTVSMGAAIFNIKLDIYFFKIQIKAACWKKYYAYVN